MIAGLVINKWDIFKFLALPQIKPRITQLFGKGFQYIPYFIALVYEAVRLLPSNHPYLNVQNIGRYGVTHVIAEAANNLVLSRKNLDQIVTFILILLAMVLVVLQIVMMAGALFIQPGFSATAMAFPQNFNEFFVTGALSGSGNGQQDIAYILLDMVFGVPEMFKSCVAETGVACLDGKGNPILINSRVPEIAGHNYEDFADWPYPVHEGLHKLFEVYSYGLLIIAMMIIIYFMITVVAETAQTGTAFGKRFNKVWAPIRIVVAIGLLVPLSQGMNSAQYLVLYAAKYGSGFASNGWAYFNSTFSDHYYKDVQKLISTPNLPEVGVLVQFFNVAATCKYAYEEGQDNNDIHPYLVRDPVSTPDSMPVNSGTSYSALLNFLQGANRAVLRFGHRDEKLYPRYLGNVKPLCGEVVLNLSDPAETSSQQTEGARKLQEAYWALVKDLWFKSGSLEKIGDEFHKSFVAKTISGSPDVTRPNDNSYKNDVIEEVNTRVKDAIKEAVDAQEASGEFEVDTVLLEKGWGGAAIWYNKIASMNGAVTTAAFNIPMPSQYPYLMEYVRARRVHMDGQTTFDGRFDPGSESEGVPMEANERNMAKAMNDMLVWWEIDGSGTSAATAPTGNIMLDAISAILGTNGLFDMRKNTDVHPLAQLVGIGKGLVESSIRNLGFAAAGGVLNAAFSNFFGQVGGVGASFMITTASVGLVAGFILFYIVPFLPFIYFFFAVGGWVKGIFEAMVGVPLWALAHIRIDGNGLGGQAAVNGYFLIFEIFLRPILIIFGFLASVIILSAMVETLHDIFNIVVSNVGGYDMQEELTDSAGTGISTLQFYRSSIDQFFYTVVYAIIVYMMAQSSFKLIDLIPNNILRWMGQSVTTFNDQRQDPAQGLVSTAQIGAQQTLGNIGGGVQGILSATAKK